jgi:hypothetical protein
MFHDKILKSVAEAVKKVLATEKLHPNQQKLDVHEPEKDKLTSKDFEMLRKGKKADVKESNNPFDVKNYKSQLKSKPGEKAGFDSKKISTGTVYTKKPAKDEKPMKEAASQEDYVKEIEKAKKKANGEGNPDLAKGSVTAVKQESVEQIDELKKSTLASYVKKASHDVAAKGAATRQFANDSEAARKDQNYTGAKKSMDKADKTFAKSWKRREGMGKAVDRLAKEEVEHIEERELTSGEKATMEKNVKGMKKNLAGFKERYGERAKEVMYATATARAKGE